MKTSRWLAIVAMVSMVFLSNLVRAEEATPVPNAIEQQALVEMTITPDQMPARFVKIGFDRLKVQPGVVAELDKYDEGARGRAMYMESGTLIVEPLAPLLVWRAGRSADSGPEIVQPGETVQLVAGDAMYLPPMSKEEFGENDLIRITNPGSEPAVQIGLHLHDSGGGFSAPSGYSYSSGVEYSDEAGIEQISAGDTLFRVTRITAQPGTVLPYSDEAVVTFYQIDSGELTSTTADATEQRWTAGQQARYVTHDAQSTQELRVSGDLPAQIIELAVIPSAPSQGEATATSDTMTPTSSPTTASPVTTTGTSEDKPPIVGTWVVRSADPTIPFALMQFHSDGTVTNANPNVGEGLGVWVANDDGTIGVNAIFRDIDTNVGAYEAGTLRVTTTLTIDPAGNGFEGTVTHVARSVSGDIVNTFDLPETGTRLTFGAIPVWAGTAPATKPNLVSTVDVLAIPPDHPIVGTWVFQNIELGTPMALVSFNSDGTAIDHNTPWGTGLGIWAPNVDGTVSVLIVFQDIDVEYGLYEPGVSAVDGFVSVAPDKTTLTGQFTYPLIRPDGSLMETYAANERAVRLSTESTFTWMTPPEPSSAPPVAGAQMLANHLATGVWIIDANEDPTLPIGLAQLHPDGTVVVQNPALGLALGVWDFQPDGAVVIRIFWQDVELAPDVMTPGLISATTILTFEPGGATGTGVPSFELTDESGAVLGSGAYTETTTRFTIDSDPGWTEVEIPST